ncbi:MAG: hypothetical protein U1E31_02375 [Rickettsiales bacterium]
MRKISNLKNQQDLDQNSDSKINANSNDQTDTSLNKQTDTSINKQTDATVNNENNSNSTILSGSTNEKTSQQNLNTKEKLEKQINNINLELKNNTKQITEYKNLLMQQKTILVKIEDINNKITEEEMHLNIINSETKSKIQKQMLKDLAPPIIDQYKELIITEKQKEAINYIIYVLELKNGQFKNDTILKKIQNDKNNNNYEKAIKTGYDYFEELKNFYLKEQSYNQRLSSLAKKYLKKLSKSKFDKKKINKNDVKQYINKENRSDQNILEKNIKLLKINILVTNKILFYLKTERKQEFDVHKLDEEKKNLINEKTSINKEYLEKLNKINKINEIDLMKIDLINIDLICKKKEYQLELDFIKNNTKFNNSNFINNQNSPLKNNQIRLKEIFKNAKEIYELDDQILKIKENIETLNKDKNIFQDYFDKKTLIKDQDKITDKIRKYLPENDHDYFELEDDIQSKMKELLALENNNLIEKKQKLQENLEKFGMETIEFFKENIAYVINNFEERKNLIFINNTLISQKELDNILNKLYSIEKKELKNKNKEPVLKRTIYKKNLAINKKEKLQLELQLAKNNKEKEKLEKEIEYIDKLINGYSSIEKKILDNKAILKKEKEEFKLNIALRNVDIHNININQIGDYKNNKKAIIDAIPNELIEHITSNYEITNTINYEITNITEGLSTIKNKIIEDYKTINEKYMNVLGEKDINDIIDNCKKKIENFNQIQTQKEIDKYFKQKYAKNIKNGKKIENFNNLNKIKLAKDKIKIIDTKTKKYLKKKIKDFNYKRDLIEKTTQVIKIFPYDEIKKLMENYNKALQEQYKSQNLSSGISLKKQKINNNLVNIKKNLLNIDSILEKTYNFIKDNNPSESASKKEKEIFENFQNFYDNISLSDTLNKLEANFISSNSKFFKSLDTVTNQSNEILNTFKKNIKINKPKSAINPFISLFLKSNNQKKLTENITFLEQEINKKNNSLKSKKER